MARAPAGGGVVGVGGLAAREEEQALLAVRTREQGRVRQHWLGARRGQLGLGAAGHALVQRQAQEALAALHLAQHARRALGHQVDHLRAT